MKQLADPITLVKTIPSDIVIPPQPELLRQLNQEMAKDDPDFNRVSWLIGHDVAMSASLLKTVNSAFFALRHQVASVSHAISLLGLEATKNLVAGFLLKKEFDSRGLSFPRFWDSASTIADLSAFIARRLQLMDADYPYILGLFHDVGIPLMAHGFPAYMEVLKQANEAQGGLFTDTEDGQYPVNHAVIGCVVCDEWGISDQLRDVILSHHDVAGLYHFDESPRQLESRLLSILKLAECCNSLLRTGKPDTDWPRFGAQVCAFLQIEEAQVAELVEEFKGLQ
jgi:HD-like signal output (HDOD) protein